MSEPLRITNGCRFTLEDALRADEVWPKRFNCGPGALCAVLGMTPDELLPHMLDFKDRGYTNPTLMKSILDGLGVKYQEVYKSNEPNGVPVLDHALMRVQWGGRWTQPGVPMRARYRMTHWVAVRNGNRQVFDVNAICVGGWMSFREWSLALVPWLCKEVVPGWDGNWWPTHAYEVQL